MGLLLAAALAAHIQTGGDLLNVCRSDAPTCDAFISSVVTQSPAMSCYADGDLRAVVLQELTATKTDLDRSARAIVSELLAGECSAAD